MGTIKAKNFLKVLVDPADANLDIVAVHGLNPKSTEFHAEKTFTHAGAGKMWIRDFLPTQIPNARIMLFGYNANVAFETSIAGVREHATNLLNRLRLKRGRGVMDRPIIFICHSLGGIIVKQALTLAKLDETYTSIGTSTYGLCFFGTPHQGGNFASLGAIAASIVQRVVFNPSNTFMEALKKDSLFADTIVRQFRHSLEDYFVLSFYETKPLGPSLIVDQKSATLGIAKRETMIALEADHKQVCKFESEDDDNYEQVIGNILEMAEGAVEKYLETGTPRANLRAARREGDAPRREGDAPRREGDAPRSEGDASRREGDASRRESDVSYTIRYTVEVTRSSGRGS